MVVLVEEPKGPVPVKCHEVVIEHGPWGEDGDRKRGALCVKCGKRLAGPNSWCRFATTLCRDNGPGQLVRLEHLRDEAGRCRRCGGRERGLCPRLALVVEGREVASSMDWLRWYREMGRRWKERVSRTVDAPLLWR